MMGDTHQPIQRIEREDLPGLRLTDSMSPLCDFSTEELSPNSLRAIAAVEDVSRRIENLASSLGCLGFFDSSDGPRAA